MRRTAYFALVVVSAMITPPDFFSAFLVLVPMLLLYELSIVLSASVYKLRRNQVRTLTPKPPGSSRLKAGWIHLFYRINRGIYSTWRG
nr:hypothetical protein [Paenibacillus caui]